MLFCIELIPENFSGQLVSPSDPSAEEIGSPGSIAAEAARYFSVPLSNIKLERRTLFLLNFGEEVSEEIATDAVHLAARELFTDKVAESSNSGPVSQIFNSSLFGSPGSYNIITVFRPGVTDAVGESALRGYNIISRKRDGMPPLQKVRTAALYRINFNQNEITARIEAENLAAFARTQLVNELVQDFVVYGQREYNSDAVVSFLGKLFQPILESLPSTGSVLLRKADDKELIRLSRDGLLALDLEEMRSIQNYFQDAGRDPSNIELETFAQTWSEHCYHKTFKSKINYVELDAQGKEISRETVDNLFKSCIVEPAEKLAKSWIVSAFHDNAGIISFDQKYDVSFKVETHNHPSALEPFGGANTGLGGVIRDVMAVSARPIAATDVFCFGHPDTPLENIPEGVLTPHRIFRGVVDGVRDYGNKMGVPTVNGAILFDRGYLSNPLVFCGTVGLAPHGSHPHNLSPGDQVVVVGGRTGRDGVHGATFSSIELSGETEAAEIGSVVQIGNPIEEKKTLDLLLKARDLKLYTAITDCGAGGLSSAVGEMGSETGVRVELDRVPLKYQGLEPWEIWVSEAQERMVLAIPPSKLEKFLELCKIEEVEATVLGEFTSDKLLTLNYNGKTIGQLRMDFLFGGPPRRVMTARWQARPTRPLKRQVHHEHHRPYLGYAQVLKRIMADPNIASKEPVIRLYDHEVQGATVIKPLVGLNNDGPGDAAVLMPLPNSLRGLVISNGINPRYGLLDPYHMAACAIDEAVRNALAVGADLDHMALLDNFCWGNPNDPERLGELVRAAQACRDYSLAFELPFISGKDSLNNEYYDSNLARRTSIPGTLLISAFSVMEDVSRAVTMDLKQTGNLIYILGKTRPELGASYYTKYHGQVEGEVPKVRGGMALLTFRALNKAIKAGLIRSCHDLSEGGLAVSAAEMAFSGGLGTRLDLQKVPFEGLKSERTNASLLFSETPSRFLVEVEPGLKEIFEKTIGRSAFALIGTVIAEDEMQVRGLSSATILRTHVSELKSAWQTPLFHD